MAEEGSSSVSSGEPDAFERLRTGSAGLESEHEVVSMPPSQALEDAEATLVQRGQGASNYVRMAEVDRQQLSDAFVEDTLRTLPIRPDSISDVRGPVLELARVDPTTVDVRVMHSFRAHFGQSAPAGCRNLTSPERCGQHVAELLAKTRSDTALLAGAPSHISSLSSSELSHGGLPEQNDLHVSLADISGQPCIGRPLGLGSEDLEEREDTALRREWEIDASQVFLGERITVGGFAEVFMGRYHGTLVAVKLLLSCDEGTCERFEREVEMLAKLRHPSLILFMGFASRPRPAIIAEYMQRGSLYDVIRKAGAPLEAKLQRAVALSVARGMAYLHTREPAILHLDLKSPNILVDDKWRIKIADFGLSRTRHQTLIASGARGGTPEWMAPEVLRCEAVTEKADVYSFGVVLWEVLTGQAPWAMLHTMQVVGAVGFGGQRLDTPSEGDPFLIDLFERCTQPDSALRPTFPEIVTLLEQRYAPPLWNSMSTSLSSMSVRPSGGSGEFGQAVGLAAAQLELERGSDELSAGDPGQAEEASRDGDAAERSGPGQGPSETDAAEEHTKMGSTARSGGSSVERLSAVQGEASPSQVGASEPPSGLAEDTGQAGTAGQAQVVQSDDCGGQQDRGLSDALPLPSGQDCDGPPAYAKPHSQHRNLRVAGSHDSAESLDAVRSRFHVEPGEHRLTSSSDSTGGEDGIPGEETPDNLAMSQFQRLARGLLTHL